MSSQLQPKYYQYLKTDVYPRVQFFQRMLTSLLPRFLRIIDSMDEFYVQKHSVDKIKSVCAQLLQPPKIIIMDASGEFDMYRTAALKKYFTVDVPVYTELDWKQIQTDSCALTAVIYHYKGTEKEVLSSKFADDLQRHLRCVAPEESSQSTQTSDIVTLPYFDFFSGLFIICDIECETEVDEERTEIHNKIRQSLLSGDGTAGNQTAGPGGVEDTVTQLDSHQPVSVQRILQLGGMWSAEYRLTVGHNVDIGCDISTVLENRVLTGFDLIDLFLMENRKMDKTRTKISKSVKEDTRIVDVLNTLLSHDTLIHTMTDRFQLSDSGTTLNLNNSYPTLVVIISFHLKCIMMQLLWEKYGLCQILIHKCFIKIEFQKQVESTLLNDFNVKDAGTQFLQSMFSGKTKTGSKKSLRHNSDSKESDFEKIVNSLTAKIVESVGPVIKDLEAEVIGVNQVMDMMKKMNFEISGYYKRTQLREDRVIKSLHCPKQLQEELLSLDDVIGCGFMYGTFEILVKENSADEHIDDTIEDIMKPYRNIGQYTVKRVQVSKSGDFIHHGYYVQG